MKTIKKIWGWITSIGIAFVFTLFIGVFLLQPYKIEGHSMDPTLHDKERVYVSKLPHTFAYLPEYGDIVIIDSRVDRSRSFKDDIMDYPLIQLMTGSEDHTFFVKRAIGKPGDTLEFKDHKVYRNGKAIDEPYLKETMNYASDKKWTVPENHIFVMGDNRNNSLDSRELGFIPLDHVMGKKLLQ